jgi:MATE family multidrug resistance protein
MATTINRDIIRLAVPNIVSNITIPLLGMVDLAIVGHLSIESYIGAIATASLVFNFMYWGFSFLRMGTSGFTAQAYGAGNKREYAAILWRSILIALIFGSVIIVLQGVIFRVAFHFIKATPEVAMLAGEYFYIYVWAAPAVLGMYAFSGWFVGMQDARTPMFIAIASNIINIVLSLLFVYGLKMNIRGVALGSTIAQLSGFLLALAVWYFKYANVRKVFDFSAVKAFSAYIPFFKVNSDIFIRTLLLITVTAFFTSISARAGNLVLAANTLLMQLFILFSYMMDGFAYAAEALTGKFIGAKQKNKLGELVHSLFRWGWSCAGIFMLVYGLFSEQILRLLTDKEDVLAVCADYRMWALLIPVAGFSAFLWDGIFIGATASKQMRNSMFAAAACFFAVYYSLSPLLGNNALWLAFVLYLSVRGIAQAFMYRVVKQRVA